MDTGFVSRLFDFSFRTFVTTSIIKILYVLALAGAVIVTLLVFAGFARGGAAGAVLGLIVAPIVLAVSVIVARVYMEILIVLFRIAENTEIIANASASGGAPRAGETDVP